MPDGPGGFTQDSSCPALLRMPLRLIRVHVRSCHALWRHFPEPSIPLTSCDGAVLLPRTCRNTCGLGCSPFARHYWGNHCCFLFLRVLRCFSSPRWPFPALASIPDGCHPFRMTGCPIRKSADQRLCAPPRGFSQLAASFIASESLGIRRAPFLTFSAAAGIGGLAYTLAFHSSRLYAGIVFCARFYVSLVTSCHRTSLTVENNGFEPLTPCVQSRCSSQLS